MTSEFITYKEKPKQLTKFDNEFSELGPVCSADVLDWGGGFDRSPPLLRLSVYFYTLDGGPDRCYAVLPAHLRIYVNRHRAPQDDVKTGMSNYFIVAW